MTGTIDVLDMGRLLSFSIDEMLNYSGPGSPGGVAQAFKMLERALPLLDPAGPPQRRQLFVRTAFAGPGARDAIELVTRAATEDRYVVDPALGLAQRGPTLEPFVFRIAYREAVVTLAVCEGIVSDEFVALARNEGRSPSQEERLDRLKLEMFDQVMGLPAEQVYDVIEAA